MVDSFVPNDDVQYSINENYREPNKPFFATVNLKGGGDAASAARAVLQTGDWDFAWNLQVEPQCSMSWPKAGKGDLVIIPGTAVEFLTLNFSDPNKEVDGQRSQWQTPHPVPQPTRRCARRWRSASTARRSRSNLYFGPPGEPPASNILLGIAGATSPEHHLGVRPRQGRPRCSTRPAGCWMATSERRTACAEARLRRPRINAVRQKTQAVIKQRLGEDGRSRSQLLEIEAGIFFDTSRRQRPELLSHVLGHQ